MAAILTTPLGLTIPLSNLAVKYLAVAHRELSGPMPAARLPATRRLVEIAVALAPPAFALFPFIWAALFLAYVRIAREWGEGVVAGW